MARCGGSAGEVDPWCEVGAWEVWAKRMPNGGQAVLVINRSDGPVSVTLALQELCLGATARALVDPSRRLIPFFASAVDPRLTVTGDEKELRTGGAG